MKTKIPKIIHQIWIGNEIPSKFKEFTDKMKEVHEEKGYKHYLWGNELWDKYKDDLYIDAYRGKGFPLAYVTDRFRILLLRDYGGIAVDPDCELIRSFDTILNRLSENITYFCGSRRKIDKGALFECGIQGTIPNSRVIKEFVKVWDIYGTSFAPGGLKTSNRLIEIIDTDVAILNHEHFFTYKSNKKTILLHEPHTLDTWRKPESRKQYQKRRADTMEKIKYGEEVIHFSK
tara:strand:+ start:328 stop:1023 length:696 start_codon:yes stop_codon:yes gene_type:complete